jgi:hypothetical protein
MPALHLFGRRFNFSSDDLTCPSLIDIILRIPLLIIFIIFRVKDESSNFTCPSSFLSVYVSIILISLLICYVSVQGTPVNNIRPRRYMPFLIYIRLFLVLIDIGINIIGLTIIVRIFQTCEYVLRGTIILSIVISYTAAITLFVILAFFIDLTGVVSAEQKWQMRIKFLFCCGRNYGKKSKCVDFVF